MRKILALIFICCSPVMLFSQEVYHFTKGLIVSAPARYGREAIYTDQLAYQLYTKTLKQPADGEQFGMSNNGTLIKWQAITADSINRFRMRGGGPGGGGFGGGYLYLTYTSAKEQSAVLNIKGNSGLYFNGEPHTGDAYALGWLFIPVKLKKGLNELYIRGGQIIADLIFPPKPVSINPEDPTLPFVVIDRDNSKLKGAIVIINTTSKELKGLQLKSKLYDNEVISQLPSIPAMGTRKVIFDLNGNNIIRATNYNCSLTLLDKSKVIDERTIEISAVESDNKYSNTFVSNIDGSLQYYAVTPQSPSPVNGSALFLSVHGAGVEAIGQARAYKSKDWGTLVAATNRRPRGFNWEDWGRLDALEVLSEAKKVFNPDPQHIYLTGHSMGGHGTWYLGVTYPDKWAGIGACSGYPTLKGYGSADGLIPDSSRSVMEQMLLRASNPSDVLKMVSNYKPLGIYVLHGDADRVVPVRYARQMRGILGAFHADLSYYEYPNGEHWFGDQSVDWKPLFDFFKWHTLLLDSAVDNIDFMTPSPGISPDYRWISIQQQIHPLQYSRVQLTRDKKNRTITGTTENVKVLQLNLSDLALTNGATVNITLDKGNVINYNGISGESIFLVKENDTWYIGYKPAPGQKNSQRYGTFKEAFNNRMVFVYSTAGNKEENEWSFNKARFDAETWYYRGNGAVDIIADKEYSPANYAGRNIILYGNANSNAAWKTLLADCPIQVQRNSIKVGEENWQGDDFGAYFCWPVKGSPSMLVGVIGGTGLRGMNATTANQYFAGGSGFPDFMIFRLDMLQSGVNEIRMAGFFDNDWKLSASDYILNK